MPYDLAGIVRRSKPGSRRRSVILRPIQPTGVQAGDLFRAAYRRVIEIWSSALPSIVAEYERTLSQIQADALTTDRAVDLGNILTEVDGLITRFMLQVSPILSQFFSAFQIWHQQQWRSSILAGTGVELGALIGPETTRETVQQAIERNVSLVRSVSDDARKRISEAVFVGLQQRKPPREVAKDLAAAVELPRKRALRIAADQLVKISSELDRERIREAGIEVWAWRHSGKLHPRKWHLARNGKLYSEFVSRVGTEIGGKEVNPSPPADDLPGMQPFCGCGSRAVLTFD